MCTGCTDFAPVNSLRNKRARHTSVCFPFISKSRLLCNAPDKTQTDSKHGETRSLENNIHYLCYEYRDEIVYLGAYTFFFTHSFQL